MSNTTIETAMRRAIIIPCAAVGTPGVLACCMGELKLKPPPISAKKATAVSLRKIRHWKGRNRSDLVRSMAGVMHSLALSGLIGAWEREYRTFPLQQRDLFAAMCPTNSSTPRELVHIECGGVPFCRGSFCAGLLPRMGGDRR